MDMEKWIQRRKLATTLTITFFCSLTLSLLSLLLPLSFLLLARLSTVHRPFNIAFTNNPTFSSIVAVAVVFETNPPVVHAFVLSICVSTFLHAVTGWTFRHNVHVGWTLLCLLQLCVGLGIEATIAAGVWSVEARDGVGITWAQQACFTLGLYEITLFWSRSVVRPLVDDTVYGVEREDNNVDRAVMGAAFVTLWWLRLINEVEILELADFFCWGIYYITVLVGVVRSMKGIAKVGRLLICKNLEELIDGNNGDVGDKV